MKLLSLICSVSIAIAGATNSCPAGQCWCISAGGNSCGSSRTGECDENECYDQSSCPGNGYWCQRACDLDVAAGEYTCGARIDYLTSTGHTDNEARNQISSEFPTECGACSTGPDPYFDYYCTTTPNTTCGNSEIPCFFDKGPACADGEQCCFADGKTPNCRFCNSTLCPDCPPPPEEHVRPEPCGKSSSSSPTRHVCGNGDLPCFADRGCEDNGNLTCCMADGERPECRFCDTGFCPACPSNGPPPKCGTLNGGTHSCNGVPCFWDEDCLQGGVGCNADGKHQECRFCGSELTPDCP